MDVDDAYEVMTKSTLNWTNNDYENLNQQNPNSIQSQQQKQPPNSNPDEVSFILCPLCQTPIKPNAVNLCIECLNSRHDISEGIARELLVFTCRGCERWYKNPQWVSAPRESAPLMELLLKKISGLNRREIKLIDAKFVWTEPHSRRTVIRITIQKEVMQNAVVEKSFEVTFIEENQQCKDCQKSFTHHTWKACVQLRQKVEHKRTFLFLEQLILKRKVVDIRNVSNRRKWECAELELIRENDLGDESAPVLEAVTHLGKHLQPGDMVKGYDLSQLVTHSDLVHDKNLRPYLKKHKMPDVIVVRKHYERRRKRRRRKWMLKSLAKEREYSVDKLMAEREERDNELFMRELEEDFELRAQIKIYKDPKYDPMIHGASGSEDDDDMPPEIPDEELIDEMKELTMNTNDDDEKNGGAEEDEDDDIDLM